LPDAPLWRLLAGLKRYDKFKEGDRPLELVHLKIRTLVRDITTALGQAPENQELPERLRQLQEDLADLEPRAPWIVTDFPVEMALWG
jgi:hypothetical protein